MVCIVVFLLCVCGCDFAGENRTASEPRWYSNRFPENLKDVIALRAAASAKDQLEARERIADARQQFHRGPVGRSGATKYYAESLLQMPTVEGLFGYAEADLLMPITRETSPGCETSKRGVMERSLTYYQLAIDLSASAGEPFPEGWSHQLAEDRIACLRGYTMRNQAPSIPGCDRFIEMAMHACQTTDQ